MAVKSSDSGKKVPALSDLAGEVVPLPNLFSEGKPCECSELKLWRRPHTRDETENIALISTEGACQIFEVSPQTLGNWVREKPELRKAFGWWSLPALIQWVAIEREYRDRRGRPFRRR